MRRKHAVLEAGFTLIEILIAMVILMVGLLGILAVFPTAMRSATRAVEDTYCAAISQSVVDAIRMGLRSMHAHFGDGRAFFIFDHDGVLYDGRPLTNPQDWQSDLEKDRQSSMLSSPGHGGSFDMEKPASLMTIQSRSYCILLPDPKMDGTEGGGRGRAFLYPRATPQDNQSRLTLGAPVKGRAGEKPKVIKVYQLGQKIGNDPTKSKIMTELEKRDPYPQYGFAFTLRPTKAPDPLNPANLAQQQIVPGLFEVVVMVYRNFQPDPKSPFNDPIREFVTYVSE